MTNNHVVGNKDTVEISFNNDDSTIGTVIGRLKTPDIALVSINNYPDEMGWASHFFLVLKKIQYSLQLFFSQQEFYRYFLFFYFLLILLYCLFYEIFGYYELY